MIRSFTAVTGEIDDVELAVEEILGQLSLEGRLLKNSIGILSCFAEYAESGVVAALCERLPFDVVGLSTIANAVPGSIGDTTLALLVITGDDISFSVSLTEPAAEEAEAPFRACFESALARLPGRPALMLSFTPLLTGIGSDYYVDLMSEISGNVPNFGALAVDHNEDYRDSRVILNGESWSDRFAMLLIHGDVDPAFYIGTISDEKLFQEKGVVTASKGNQLQTVNNAPIIDYLLSLGLSKNEDGSIVGINSFPIIVDYNDGTMPVVRAMFAITPEGYAVCGGNIPVGSTISIGSFDAREIIETTDKTVGAALDAKRHSVMLMYSCVGRFFTQGYESRAEFETMQRRMEGSSVSYLAAYSGGELCPVYRADGKTVNRNHNNTFVICAF